MYKLGALRVGKEGSEGEPTLRTLPHRAEEAWVQREFENLIITSVEPKGGALTLKITLVYVAGVLYIYRFLFPFSSSFIYIYVYLSMREMSSAARAFFYQHPQVLKNIDKATSNCGAVSTSLEKWGLESPISTYPTSPSHKTHRSFLLYS